MLSNDRIFDYGSAMKKVVDVIMNLDTDIYVKAWKRSGLIPEQLIAMDFAENLVI